MQHVRRSENFRGGFTMLRCSPQESIVLQNERMSWMVRLFKVTAALAIVCAALVVQPAPASADFTGCITKATDPHIASASSGGPGGIVAKSILRGCDHRHDMAEINPTLYKCDLGHPGGPPSENWIFDNCNLVRWEFHKISPALANTEYVRQVPRVGAAEAHGRGWFVEDTVFALHNNGKVWTRGRTSNVVFLDG